MEESYRAGLVFLTSKALLDNKADFEFMCRRVKGCQPEVQSPYCSTCVSNATLAFEYKLPGFKRPENIVITVWAIIGYLALRELLKMGILCVVLCSKKKVPKCFKHFVESSPLLGCFFVSLCVHDAIKKSCWCKKPAGDSEQTFGTEGMSRSQQAYFLAANTGTSNSSVSQTVSRNVRSVTQGQRSTSSVFKKTFSLSDVPDDESTLGRLDLGDTLDSFDTVTTDSNSQPVWTPSDGPSDTNTSSAFRVCVYELVLYRSSLSDLLGELIYGALLYTIPVILFTLYMYYNVLQIGLSALETAILPITFLSLTWLLLRIISAISIKILYCDPFKSEGNRSRSSLLNEEEEYGGST